MRNLKRVLSLALASIMLMGMMVMGASAADKKTAADLTDMDKVTNKAAVSLLVDLGIIVGKPDGSYAPAETVTRATMAKLITYIVMGDVDPSAFTGTTTDLKDVTGHWAEGYIKYCYANGFIVGDGQGHFMPDQAVTTVSAAKMLLVALGYDAKDRGYEGDPSWSVNIMKDAQKMDLLTNLSVKASDNLSRDNAAQIIYNALFAQTVQNDYSRDINGNKYVSKVTVTTAPADKLGYITYGLTKVTGVLLANEYAGLGVSKAAKGYSKIDISGTTKSEKISSTTELLGHQVVYYTGNNSKLISTSLVASGKTKVYTDSTPAKANNSFVKDNDLDLTNVKYSTNYSLATSSVWTGSGVPKAGDTVVYINSDGTGAVEYAVLISYTFGKVTAVDSAKGTLTVTGAFGTKKVVDVTGADKVAKDDYVVYATVGGETIIEKAATVTGTVTRKTSTTLTVDGTAYTVAANGSAGSITETSTVKFGENYRTNLDVSKATEQTFVLNKGGLIVLVVGKEVVASKYAYIEAFKVSTDPWDSTSKTVEVKAVLSDGTQETYVLAGGTDSLKVAAATAGNAAALTALKGVYKYTINSDGKMVTKTTDEVTDTATATFKTGKPEFVTSVFVDASTVVLYVYADDDGKTQSASYTGISNIPNITNTQVVYSKKSGSDFAEFVFVNAEPEKAQSVAKYAYVYSATTADVAKGTEVKVVIDGNLDTLVIKTGTVEANTIYTYTTDSDGVSTLVKLTGSDKVIYDYTTVSTVGSNYVITTSGTVIYLDKDATVDDLTNFSDAGKLEPTKGTLAKGSTIVYAKVGGSGSNKDNIAKAYIVPAPVAGTVAIENIDGTLYATISGFEGGTVSYQWQKDGTNIPGATSDSYKLPAGAAGEYTLDVTVTSKLDSTQHDSETSNTIEISTP